MNSECTIENEPNKHKIKEMGPDVKSKKEDATRVDETKQEDATRVDETKQEDATRVDETKQEDATRVDETKQEDATRVDETKQEDATRVDETKQEYTVTDSSKTEYSYGSNSDYTLSVSKHTNCKRFSRCHKKNYDLWYRPIDPTLRAFLKDYYYSKRKAIFKMSCMPCLWNKSYMIHLGSCTLLKRRIFKKIRKSTLTNVIFANFSSYELEITVKTIATNINGFAIGLFGNNVTIDVSKTEPIPQIITIQPILYNYGLIRRVKEDPRILCYSSKKKIPKTKKHLIIPECLSASTAQIDPASRSYYLTVRIKHNNSANEYVALFEDLLHHSNCDVIFEDVHLDSKEIGARIKARIKQLTN